LATPAEFELTRFGLSERRKQTTGVPRTAEETDRLLPSFELAFRDHYHRAGFPIDTKRFAAGLVHLLGRVLAEFIIGNMPVIGTPLCLSST
jgi:hypothetical protein